MLRVVVNSKKQNNRTRHIQNIQYPADLMLHTQFNANKLHTRYTVSVLYCMYFYSNTLVSDVILNSPSNPSHKKKIQC